MFQPEPNPNNARNDRDPAGPLQDLTPRRTEWHYMTREAVEAYIVGPFEEESVE